MDIVATIKLDLYLSLQSVPISIMISEFDFRTRRDILDEVCQYISPFSSSNTTACRDISEILLKVALNTNIISLFIFYDLNRV
jgi:hypothetical protein